ncbi:MAG TPA: OmpA family protein [Steroidobacteraceae bacterium]|jgi:outer membrane protein OmpA-like peptidoglycan-associated protein
MRTLLLTAISTISVLLYGCVTPPSATPGTAGAASQGQTFHVKEVRTIANPCDVSRQRMSSVGGSALGAVIGFGVCRLATQALGGKTSTADKNRISAGCAVVGGIVGYTWAADSSRRQCDVYQAAQRAQLAAQFQEVTVVLPPPPGDTSHKAEEATVSVTTLPGLGHFAPGSAALTPQARQYFLAIAGQYTFDAQKNSLARSLPASQQKEASDPQKLDTLKQDWDRIPIVLIGHTDDTGSDTANAAISEQRARAVADVFRAAGVSADRIYYQGAGSSLPQGDNRTDEGRALNRRVEVVELPPGSDVAKYLSLRNPNPDLFRPLPQSVAEAPSFTSPPVARAAVAKKPNRDSDAFEDVPATPTPKPRTDRPPSSPTSRPPVTGTAGQPLAGASGSAAAGAAGPPVASAGRPSAASAGSNSPLSIDFGGVPAPARVTSVADALGRPRPERGGWGFIQSAVAEDEPIYAVACTRDAPDLNRPLPAKQLSTGQPLKTYETREYLPGFNDSAWLGSTNGHGVGLNHVAVLREGDQPVSNPDVLVYRDMDRTGNVKANLTAPSRVKVYEGEKALLYRVFVQNPTLRCLDIVVPPNGSLNAEIGNLYYEHDHKIFTAPYAPKRLQAQ